MSSKSIRDIHPDAWAEVVDDVLWGFQVDSRIEILEIALANAQREAAEDEDWERDHPGDLLRTHDASELWEAYKGSPGELYWNAIMRIEAAIAYTLIRRINNNHSKEDARKLLLGCHHDAPGSGYLEEYLDGILPRPKKAKQEA